MHGHGSRRAIGAVLAALALGVLLAAGTAKADLSGRSSAISTEGSECASKASERSSPATRRPAGLHEYDDYIEDVQSAPDICSANLVTNDNETVTIAMHIHDRFDFAAGEVYSVVLDTDSNAATGGTADSGATAGAEYVIDVTEGAASLRKWTGSTFELVTPQREILTAWIDALGPALRFDRADIGDTPSFQFRLMTSNGADIDLAPDAGGWSYALSPLALTAERFSISPARAGKPFVAELLVVRSDFEIPLEEGAVACTAKVGGKPLAGRGTFGDQRVACRWRVPKAARGKQLRGSVAVTFQGVTVKRPFAVRVR